MANRSFYYIIKAHLAIVNRSFYNEKACFVMANRSFYNIKAHLAIVNRSFYNEKACFVMANRSFIMKRHVLSWKIDRFIMAMHVL